MGLPTLGNSNASGVHTPASASFSISHTINSLSNRLLIAFAYSQNVTSRGTISGVTYNGVAMTQYLTLDVGAETLLRLYYLLDASLPAGGSYTLTVTSASNPASIQDLLLASVCFSNVYQAGPFTGGNTAGGTSTSPSVSVTSLYSDMLVAAIAADNSNATVSFPAEQTQLWNSSVSLWSRLAGSYEIGAVGSTTASGTLSASVPWGIVAASVRGTPGRNFQIIN